MTHEAEMKLCAFPGCNKPARRKYCGIEHRRRAWFMAHPEYKAHRIGEKKVYSKSATAREAERLKRREAIRAKYGVKYAEKVPMYDNPRSGLGASKVG